MDPTASWGGILGRLKAGGAYRRHASTLSSLRVRHAVHRKLNLDDAAVVADARRPNDRIQKGGEHRGALHLKT